MSQVELPPQFVIPGGNQLSAQLDVARTIDPPRRAPDHRPRRSRRAERRDRDPFRQPRLGPRLRDGPLRRRRRAGALRGPRQGAERRMRVTRPPPGWLRPRGRDRGWPQAPRRRAAEAGGTDTGPRPTQLLAASLAALHAVTIEMYAARKGWDFGAGRGRRWRSPTTDSCPPALRSRCASPGELSDEQRERLLAIAAQMPGPPDPRPAIPTCSSPSGSSRSRWTSDSRGAPAWSPAPAAGSAARRRGCSAPRGQACCLSPATRSGCATSRRPRRRPAEGGGRAAHLALDVTAEDAGERMLAAATEHFGSLDVLVNNAGAASWRDLDEVPDDDWRAQYELNVMAPLRAMRADRTGDGRARLGPDRQRLLDRRQAPLGGDARVLGRQGRRALALAPLRRPLREARRPRQRDLPRAGRARRCGWSRAACSTNPSGCRGAASREEALARGRLQAPDRPARRGR